MTTNNKTLNATVPAWATTAVQVLLVSVLASTLAIAVIVARGVTDPAPSEPPSFSASNPAELRGLGLAPQLSADQLDTQIHWLPDTKATAINTFIAQLAQTAGTTGMRYGIVLETDSTRQIQILVAETGFLGITSQQNNTQRTLYDWQRWPHITNGNTLQVRYQDAALTIWVNRELVQTLALDAPPQRIGIVTLATDTQQMLNIHSLTGWQTAK